MLPVIPSNGPDAVAVLCQTPVSAARATPKLTEATSTSASSSNPIRWTEPTRVRTPLCSPILVLPYVGTRALTDTVARIKVTLTTRRGRLRTLLFFGIGLSAGALAILAYGLQLFPRLELTTVDTRFSIRGDAETP